MALHADHFDQFGHSIGALLQSRLLFRCQFYLDDLFQAVGAELARHAHEQVFDPVLALQVDGAGQDLFLVFQNRLDHLRGRGGRRVVGAARLEVLYDLSSAIAGALDDRIETVFGDEFGDRDPGDGGVARQWNHGVTVAAENERGHVLYADVKLLGDESAEARGIEDAGHPDHAVARELAQLVRGLGHGVEGIGDHDEDAVGRVGYDFGDDILHDFEIRVQQVIAAHARFAGDACGDHDDVRVGRIGVVVGAQHEGVALFDRHGLKQVQALALGNALENIDEHNVRQFLGSDPMSSRRAHIAGACNRYFLAHECIPSLRFWGFTGPPTSCAGPPYCR